MPGYGIGLGIGVHKGAGNTSQSGGGPAGIAISWEITDSVFPARIGTADAVCTIKNNESTAQVVAVDVTSEAGIVEGAPVASLGTYLAPTWTVGSLASGASATLTFTLTNTTVFNAFLTMTGDVTAPVGLEKQAVSDGIKWADIDMAPTVVVTNDNPGVGLDVTLTFKGTNAGPDDASAVTYALSAAPTGVTYKSVTPSIGTSFASGVWTLPTVLAAAEPELVVVATMDTDEGVVSTTLTLTASNETETNTGNNVATANYSADTPAFVPSDIPGLYCWLQADMGVTEEVDGVSLWLDQSDQGNDYSQNTGSLRPEFVPSDLPSGNPYLKAGVDDYMVATLFDSGVSGPISYYILKWKEVGASNFWWGNGSYRLAHDSGAFLTTRETATINIGGSVATGSSWASIQHSMFPPINRWSVRKNAANSWYSAILRDNEMSAPVAGGITPNEHSRIFKHPTGGGGPTRIAMILCYAGSEISDADDALLRQYLRDYSGHKAYPFPDIGDLSDYGDWYEADNSVGIVSGKVESWMDWRMGRTRLQTTVADQPVLEAGVFNNGTLPALVSDGVSVTLPLVVSAEAATSATCGLFLFHDLSSDVVISAHDTLDTYWKVLTDGSIVMQFNGAGTENEIAPPGTIVEDVEYAMILATHDSGGSWMGSRGESIWINGNNRFENLSGGGNRKSVIMHLFGNSLVGFGKFKVGIYGVQRWDLGSEANLLEIMGYLMAAKGTPMFLNANIGTISANPDLVFQLWAEDLVTVQTGQEVEKWVDGEGGIEFSQATPANRPTQIPDYFATNRIGISADGIDDILEMAGAETQIIPSMGEFSVFCVAEASSGFVSVMGNPAGSNHGITTETDGSIHMHNAATEIAPNGSWPLDTPVLIEAHRNGAGDIECLVNGVDVSAGASFTQAVMVKRLFRRGGSDHRQIVLGYYGVFEGVLSEFDKSVVRSILTNAYEL